MENSSKLPVYISRREKLITCLQVSDSTTTTLQLELISWLSLPQIFGDLFTACSITHIIKVFIFLALVRHPVNFLDAAHNEMVRERQVCMYLKQEFLSPFEDNKGEKYPSYLSVRVHIVVCLDFTRETFSDFFITFILFGPVIFSYYRGHKFNDYLLKLWIVFTFLNLWRLTNQVLSCPFPACGAG